MSELVSLAKPYAKATYELAKELGQVDQWSTLLEALQALVSHEQVREIIAAPEVDGQAVCHLLITLLGDMADQHGKNFLMILTRNKRLGLLPQIAVAFGEMKALDENKVSINVVTAAPVQEGQQASLEKQLRDSLDSNVDIAYNVDEEVIGGAVFRIGDKVIDASIKNQLARLLKKFKGSER